MTFQVYLHDYLQIFIFQICLGLFSIFKSIFYFQNNINQLFWGVGGLFLESIISQKKDGFQYNFYKYTQYLNNAILIRNAVSLSFTSFMCIMQITLKILFSKYFLLILEVWFQKSFFHEMKDCTKTFNFGLQYIALTFRIHVLKF